MPDQYGFDHLPTRSGVEVRCTREDCSIGGPLHLWPVRLRASHFRMHDREARRAREKAAAKARRQATRRIQAINRVRREEART